MHLILAAWLPILYAGILSNGVAYTLQFFAQRGLPASTASLLMSTESVFSLLAGFLILHQMLNGRELTGTDVCRHYSCTNKRKRKGVD